MTMFLIQSAILLAIAFIIGSILGCLLRRMFGIDTASVPAVATSTAVAATAAAAIVVAKAEPEKPSAPEPVADETVVAPALIMSAPKAEPKIAPKPKAKVAAKVSVAKPIASKVAATPAKPDDLKLIVGIGPVNERKLHGVGVNRFAQIAAWTPKDEQSYGARLEFPGRIEREEWVRQAKNLAADGKSDDSGELKRKGGSAQKAATLISGVVASASETSSTKSSASKATGSKTLTPKVATKPVKAEVSAVKKTMAAKLSAPIGGKPDNLTLIDGIGNVIEKKLHELGVFHFEQIANWTKDMADDFSKAVGFPGRATREGWIKEAALFAKGGTTDHAGKVEAGKIKSSRVSTSADKATKKK